MVIHTLKKYKKLISEMPLSEHSSTSKRDTWKNKSRIVRLLFVDKEESITISREDVFDYAEKRKGAMEEFICAALVWGYPAGNRGNIEKIVGNKNIKRLIEHLNNLPLNIQSEHLRNKYRETKDKNKNIEGLGLSTYTKFLYFLKISIDKHQALILDNKLIEVFNRRLFRDFDELKKISRDNAMKKYYTTYLERMHKVGKELKLGTRGVEKLEMFLHVFGSNIKTKSLYR